MARVIGHIDLDYFYAQVEEVLDRSLKTKPVLVCVYSGRTEDSGVVSTANYVARGLGVRSGMPIALAKKKVAGTGAAFIKMERSRYEEVSGRVMQLVESHADAMEQTGIDEAFFDLTAVSGGDFEAGRAIAKRMKSDVLRREGLTASIGIGRSKTVAKMASDFQKPDGLTMVKPEATEAFLAQLPLINLFGVGPKTEKTLNSIGITTVGQLAGSDVVKLEGVVGKKLAVYLHSAATGTDDEPVSESRGASQLSRIITLKSDTRDATKAFTQLSPAIKELEARIAARKLSFRTVSVIGILTDLSTHTKSKTYETRVSDPSVLSGQTLVLLGQLTDSVGKDLRRVGVRVSDLAPAEDQASLTEFLRGDLA